MGTKDRCHHKVSSFNPAWCLRPPPMKATTPHHSNSNHGNKSPLSSYRHKKSHPHQVHHHSPHPTVEPTSPRVGCMGQIRRCKALSNATGPVYSSSSSGTSRSSSVSPQSSNMLMMLRRGANGSSVNTSISSSGSSLNASPLVIPRDFSLLMLKRASSTRLSLEEMDPPRPVEKKEVKPENSVSLWKRRCGGKGDLVQVQLQAIRTDGQCLS